MNLYYEMKNLMKIHFKTMCIEKNSTIIQARLGVVAGVRLEKGKLDYYLRKLSTQ